MGGETDSSDSEPALKAARLLTKRHTCHHENCGATFSRPGRLFAHLDQHLGKKHFKCKVKGCRKSYTNNAHLKRHISTSHEERTYVPVFICEEPGCLRQLSNKTNLLRHHQQMHNKPFVCETCGTGFNKHRKLSAHMVSHTGVYPFKCGKCGVNCATNYELTRHSRGHRTHTCSWPDCALSFDTWTKLRKHYKLDHPLRYECSDCLKVFTSKSNLRMHTEIHLHPFDRDVLQCPHGNCPRFYFHKKNLMHHIRSSHEGKRFPCDFPGCERTFCTKGKLESHKKLHNPGARLPRRRCNSRKKRKDAGQPKRSIAAKLSGARVPYAVEKLVRDSSGKLEEQLAGEQAEDPPAAGERTTAPNTCSPPRSDDVRNTTHKDGVRAEANPSAVSSKPSLPDLSVNGTDVPFDLDKRRNSTDEGAAADASQKNFPEPCGRPSVTKKREMSGTSLLARTAISENSLDDGKEHRDLPAVSRNKTCERMSQKLVARVTLADGNVPLTSNKGRLSQVERLEVPLAKPPRIKSKTYAVKMCTSRINSKLPGVVKELDSSDNNSVTTKNRSSVPAASDEVNLITTKDGNLIMLASGSILSHDLDVWSLLASEMDGTASRRCDSNKESGGVCAPQVTEGRPASREHGRGCDLLCRKCCLKCVCGSSELQSYVSCRCDSSKESGCVCAPQVTEGRPASREHGRSCDLLCCKCCRKCVRGCSELQSTAPEHKAPMLFSIFTVQQWLSAMMVAMRLTIPQAKDPV